jgi:hypothetical protein
VTALKIAEALQFEGGLRWALRDALGAPNLPVIPRVEDIWTPSGETPDMLLDIEADLGMQDPPANDPRPRQRG